MWVGGWFQETRGVVGGGAANGRVTGGTADRRGGGLGGWGESRLEILTLTDRVWMPPVQAHMAPGLGCQLAREGARSKWEGRGEVIEVISRPDARVQLAGFGMMEGGRLKGLKV